jgi:hypothetical protein
MFKRIRQLPHYVGRVTSLNIIKITQVQVSDLALAGANDSLYMNIHSVEHPDREIHGTPSIPP